MDGVIVILRVMLLLGIGLPGAAGAQTIYKCVDAKRQVSLQSHPCAAGQRQVRASTYAPVVDDPAAAARLRTIEAEMDARARDRRATPRAQPMRDPGNDGRSRQRAQCGSARRSRQATLDRAGLRRTYDLLQRLDENVRNACQGL